VCRHLLAPVNGTSNYTNVNAALVETPIRTIPEIKEEEKVDDGEEEMHDFG